MIFKISFIGTSKVHMSRHPCSQVEQKWISVQPQIHKSQNSHVQTFVTSPLVETSELLEFKSDRIQDFTLRQLTVVSPGFQGNEKDFSLYANRT